MVFPNFCNRDDWYKNDKTGFKARKVKKNKTNPKPGGRTRPKRKPRPLPAAICQAIVREGDFTFKPDMECLTQYPHQEKIISCLDRYIYKLFDAGGDAWTADLLNFTSRKVPRGNALASWQELADQTYGVSVLIRFGNVDRAEVNFNNCLDRLRPVARHDDPSIFVKFWRICLAVDGIDSRCGRRINAKSRLLERLKQIFVENGGEEHLLAEMVSSLSEVSSSDFRDTLRIGFDKTLRTTTALVGDENAMVLHMWSHFFKYWDSQFLDTAALLHKFQWLWDKIYREGTELHSEEAISVHYYYAYAAYYLCETKLLGNDMVVQLFYQTERYFRMVDEPKWSLTTLAFAFSAKTTALIHRSKGEVGLCWQVMNVTIQKLERGDRECATRAAMLSRLLARWQKQ